jgi:cytochrome b subunit of formate dehydrogenase
MVLAGVAVAARGLLEVVPLEVPAGVTVAIPLLQRLALLILAVAGAVLALLRMLQALDLLAVQATLESLTGHKETNKWLKNITPFFSTIA